jgi:hypothetical protein
MTPIDWLKKIEALYIAKQYDEAVRQAQAFLKTNKKPSLRAACAAMLVDLGYCINDIEMIRQATFIMNDERHALSGEALGATFYNLANGWTALADIEDGKSLARWTSVNAQNAKACYREALRVYKDISKPPLIQYFVNYANRLDSQGRHLEAIKLYDAALKLDPAYGMAQGNKGIALRYFSHVTVQYPDALLIWAYQLLKKSLDDNRIDLIGGGTARARFEEELALMRKEARKPEYLEKSLDHPSLDMKELPDFEHLFIDLCIKEHLFINVHIHEKACKAAIIDDISMPSDLSSNSSDLVLGLNQIKEDLIAARYLWVLAQFNDTDLEKIDKRTFFDKAGKIEASLRHGLLKAAFLSGFNILDKIAFFLNYYLKIGIPIRAVYFTTAKDKKHCLWYDCDNDKLRIKIEENFKYGLAALYDIFIDFDRNQITGKAFYNELKKMRHALTHRWLDITETKDLTTLITTTRDMLFLARCAIMYLILFVHNKEMREKKEELVA